MTVIAFIHLRGNFETTRFETLKLSGTYEQNRTFHIPPSICGRHWQRRYQELHADIVSGRKKPAYLVYSCPWKNNSCCGYGNRVYALVSIFYLAVLTNRAFLIDWQTPKPLEDFLTPRGIEWNLPVPHLNTRKHYWRSGGENDDLRKGWLPKSIPKFVKWIRRKNVRKYFDRPVEVATTFLFFVRYGMRRNKHLMKEARKLKIKVLMPGASTYGMIGCAYDFLFNPTKTLESSLEKTRRALRENGNFVVIGIHIRLGDAQFGNKNYTRVSNFKNFFTCAKKVERRVFRLTDPHGSDNRRCRWFLATDSAKVKDYALQHFPGKVITDNRKIQHLDKIYGKEEKSADEGMLGVLHDHFILAESDFLVLSDSSYSKTALGLGMHGLDNYTFGDECDLKSKKPHKATKHR